jgi:hypothetical protein
LVLLRGGPVQGDLFDGGWRARQRALDQAVDAIRAQFGRDAIRRAGRLDPPDDNTRPA